MANLINDLIDVLKAQTKCYKELLHMANSKKDVIINGNLLGLQQITNDEQMLAGQILRLDKKRTEIISDIALVTVIDEEELNLTRLIGLVKGKPQELQIKHIKDEMTEVIFKLKDVNSQNEMLINQSLELFDYTMNVLSSAAGGMSVNNYPDRLSSAGSSLFDFAG